MIYIYMYVYNTYIQYSNVLQQFSHFLSIFCFVPAIVGRTKRRRRQGGGGVEEGEGAGEGGQRKEGFGHKERWVFFYLFATPVPRFVPP